MATERRGEVVRDETSTDGKCRTLCYRLWRWHAALFISFTFENAARRARVSGPVRRSLGIAEAWVWIEALTDLRESVLASPERLLVEVGDQWWIDGRSEGRALRLVSRAVVRDADQGRHE